MFVNKDQIKVGLKQYIENELAPKTTDSKLKFLLIFGMPILINDAMKEINKLTESESAKEIFLDANGNINIDELRANGIYAMGKCGGKVLFKDIWFDETDINKLYNYIRG
jgi:hypothetical protein